MRTLLSNTRKRMTVYEDPTGVEPSIYMLGKVRLTVTPVKSVDFLTHWTMAQILCF